MLDFTYDEELNKLTEYIINYTADKVRDLVPEAGSFDKIITTFTTHFTKEHKGLLSVEPSASPAGQRKVVAGVIKEGTDKLYSNIMATGTKEDVLRYLSDGGTKDELVESYRKLFVSADEDR